MAVCTESGRTRWFYSGNQVGYYNHTGLENFVAGGPLGSGISAGLLYPIFYPSPVSREPWKSSGAILSQALLDACWPYIELVWIADIKLGTNTFRVSNRNVYVEEQFGPPRFYEARAKNSPTVSLTLGEWLNPTFEVGDVKLTLNNRDGFYNQFLPGGADYQQWIGAELVIRVGFGEKFSNYIEIFKGYITAKQGVTSTDTDLELKFFDRFESDSVTIPANVFAEISYPDMEETAEGKAIPMIFGDWTEEVGDFGEIPGYCTNAKEALATEYIFRISENALKEIGDVYLHRGDRSSENPNGPVRFDAGSITKEPDKGQIIIPVGVDVFLEYIDVLKSKAGPASALKFITSESAEINFIDSGIQTGDRITKSSSIPASAILQNLQFFAVNSGESGNDITVQYTPGGIAGSENVTVIGNAITVQIHSGVSKAEQIKDAIESDAQASELITVKVTGTGDEVQGAPSGPVNLAGGSLNGGSCLVTSVSNNQILTDSLTFTEGEEFIVQTKKYKFIENDKVSLFCKGKNLQNMSVNRLSDAGLPAATPVALSVGLDRTYWFADNTAQKIYQVTLTDELIQEIDYADISAVITEITGLAIQTDGTLWLFDAPSSTFFRYILEDETTGLSFTTVQVAGIGSLLVSGRGLAIDEANYLYVVDNSTGDFYKINPFSPLQPTLITSWNRSAFDNNANDTLDISADVNAQNLCVVDRNTGKFYRINRTTGALIAGSDLVLSQISSTIDFPVGVSAFQDGTIFILNRSDLTLYNYNEDADSFMNPGYIVRDLLQGVAGRLSGEFELGWNNTCRTDLAQFKARFYIQERTKLMEIIHKLLQQYNTVMFTRFGLLTLFHVTFANFRSDGDVIREGDIIENSFKPSKEYNQYFNSATAEYREKPFSEKSSTSDTYISSSGITAAGKEINRKFQMPSVYRRSDMDKILPLYVRLASPEPEFVGTEIGFRLLFSQLMDFRRISFDAMIEPVTGRKLGGRRFNLVPAFIRQIEFQLDSMTLKYKMWSLGTTRFGDWIPPGQIIGGEADKIVLTTLGNYGYISPVGTITGSGADFITIEDVNGQDAETRSILAVGNAWLPGYVVDVINAATMETVKTLVIKEIDADKITFTENIGITINNSGKNIADFITSGHFIQYSAYSSTVSQQRALFAFYGKPEVGYPVSSAEETEDQKSGVHNFPDQQLPYLLHPEGYNPS